LFEWVCPKCNRTVLAELTDCPHCAELAAGAAVPPAAPATPAPGAPARRVVRVVRRKPMNWGAVWADVERGFRFGLGFLAALAVGYFVLFFCAYVWAEPETFGRIAHWFRLF